MLGGWRLIAARLRCICSEGNQTFVRIQFLRFGDPVHRPRVCTASVFTAGADLLAAEEVSL